jgi:hypothetical protein
LQHLLMTQALGIDHCKLILGVSMGGMLTWEWGVRYPDFMDCLVPLAALPTAMSGRNWILRRLLIDSIREDPQWKGGHYVEQPSGLRRAALWFTAATNGGTLALQGLAPTREAADRWLDVALSRQIELDANDYLYQMDSSRDYDPGGQLHRICAKVLAIVSDDDERCPVRTLQEAMPKVRDGQMRVVPEGPETCGPRDRRQRQALERFAAGVSRRLCGRLRDAARFRLTCRTPLPWPRTRPALLGSSRFRATGRRSRPTASHCAKTAATGPTHNFARASWLPGPPWPAWVWKRADRVLLAGENCATLVCFVFAVSELGAAFILVNARQSADEIDAIASHAQPQVEVYVDAGERDADMHGIRRGAARALCGAAGIVRARATGLPAGPDATEAAGHGLAAMIYTSGTTGKPKGVMLTQRGLLFVALTMRDLRHLSAADCSYAVLPLSHTMGLTSVLLSTLSAGGSVWLRRASTLLGGACIGGRCDACSKACR